ncbi:aminotransferase [Ilyonectria robusta]|uniref:aminotransferase n=1 Tax=Ilyonectria robusta TaxID=1079257 RepID=UPI001E8DADB3|nr:aminotransferase [Ilyonectria robusta]KAH8656265.1 aminotransferase [Ilyonectria robusta]
MIISRDLTLAARRSDFSCPCREKKMKQTLCDMLAKRGIRDAFIQLIVTRDIKGVRESEPHEHVNTLYMFIQPYIWVMEPEMQLTGGLAIIAWTVRRTPPGSIDPTVKNHQWGDLTCAIQDARDRGAKYPFLTDDDAYFTEVSGFNVVFVKDGKIFTADRGVLEGITCKSVFDVARANNIEIRCEVVPVALTYEADLVPSLLSELFAHMSCILCFSLPASLAT